MEKKLTYFNILRGLKHPISKSTKNQQHTQNRSRHHFAKYRTITPNK